MKIQVSKNQNFESFIDIPDEYYKILSTWKKRNVGSWYRPITNQDNEAMRYLVGIISGSFYKDNEVDVILKNLNLSFKDLLNYKSIKESRFMNSLPLISIHKVETVLRNLGYEEEEIENVIKCIVEEIEV